MLGDCWYLGWEFGIHTVTKDRRQIVCAPGVHPSNNRSCQQQKQQKQTLSAAGDVSEDAVRCTRPCPHHSLHMVFICCCSQVEEKRRDVFILFKNLAKTAYAEALVFLGRTLQASRAKGSLGSAGSS